MAHNIQTVLKKKFNGYGELGSLNKKNLLVIF